MVRRDLAVASLLDFETAMTIADYTAIGVLIVLAILAVVMLYLRGKFYRVPHTLTRWRRGGLVQVPKMGKHIFSRDAGVVSHATF